MYLSAPKRYLARSLAQMNICCQLHEECLWIWLKKVQQVVHSVIVCVLTISCQDCNNRCTPCLATFVTGIKGGESKENNLQNHFPKITYMGISAAAKNQLWCQLTMHHKFCKYLSTVPHYIQTRVLKERDQEVWNIGFCNGYVHPWFICEDNNGWMYHYQWFCKDIDWNEPMKWDNCPEWPKSL